MAVFGGERPLLDSSVSRTKNNLLQCWQNEHPLRMRPQPEPQNALVALIRIPKSGSTSMSEVVHDCLPTARKFLLPDSAVPGNSSTLLERMRLVRTTIKNGAIRHGRVTRTGLLRLIESKATPGDIVSGGHVSFADLRAIRRQMRIVTLIRNPVDQLLSQYNYQRSNHFKRSSLARFDSSLQAKLAARYSLEGYVDALSERPADFGNIACQYLSIEEEKDIAQRVDRDIALIGCLEDFEGFVALLKRTLGGAAMWRRSNRTTHKAVAAVDRRTRLKIERLSELDAQLYDYVVSRHAVQSSVH